MLKKFILVAGLALMERGSTAQLLLALLIAFAYLVLFINTAPLLKWEADKMTQVANIQIFLSLMGAMVLKTERALPGSFEEAALDAMLSASSLSVMVLGAGSLLACARDRATAIKAQIDAVRDATAVTTDSGAKADEELVGRGAQEAATPIGGAPAVTPEDRKDKAPKAATVTPV